MWVAIGVLACVWVWIIVAAYVHAWTESDVQSMRRYRRERDEFERWFK